MREGTIGETVPAETVHVPKNSASSILELALESAIMEWSVVVEWGQAGWVE